LDGYCTAEIDEGEDGGYDEGHEDSIKRDVPAMVDLSNIRKEEKLG
jgi:hypothetical protein